MHNVKLPALSLVIFVITTSLYPCNILLALDFIVCMSAEHVAETTLKCLPIVPHKQIY